jgi:hypothetical protein
MLDSSDILKAAKQVLAHWPQVDAALPRPVTLKSGYTQAQFLAESATLESKLESLSGRENAQGLVLTGREAQKDVLKERLKQFRAAVQSELDGTAFLKELPKQPHKNIAESTFLKTFDDAVDLWRRINALTPPTFTPPLTLAEGYTLASFQADLKKLRDGFQEVRVESSTFSTQRQELKDTTSAVWERVKQYRKACIAKLPTGHALLNNIP